jgi:2-oxoisovalerate dehydrogenase E1 component alpha subunit
VRCDGNDPLATYKCTRAAVERAARGEGPTLIEMLTYRLGGHSTSDDPRAYRADAEVAEWQKTDPIQRMRRHLDHLGVFPKKDEDAFRAAVEVDLKKAIEQAENFDRPSLASMFDDVFASLPWHLVEQRDALLAGPRAAAHG